ncbi:hypothetical protein [Duganella sp. BuS-21]|uniref:hypothetical protein n=1 Tax=Duganella sp. BuS-21 TaxID=2943848 RepID=UPI0035A65C2E
MKDRLKWILSQMNKLMEDGQVRYEGNSVFQGMRMELESVISVADELTAPPPAIVQTLMTAEQVGEVIASIPKVGNYDSVIAGLGESLAPRLASIMHDAIEASDVAVMAAINAKGDDVVAALAAK